MGKRLAKLIHRSKSTIDPINGQISPSRTGATGSAITNGTSTAATQFSQTLPDRDFMDADPEELTAEPDCLAWANTIQQLEDAQKELRRRYTESKLGESGEQQPAIPKDQPG
ncbi:hypothetical protein [Novipirellula artificiosorum]|uniref:Uncharacterized protein n=1 Tax=Novipirellula artificiosorum TaxID=2528016 RepID=A0A5C6E2F7_9BACT|nr:hypothetical protein [Novipirellula artificiosorum]TWU42684.1 hypothetical protein Poly41_09840 [Novipirellula artificiosorum]